MSMLQTIALVMLIWALVSVLLGLVIGRLFALIAIEEPTEDETGSLESPPFSASHVASQFPDSAATGRA